MKNQENVSKEQNDAFLSRQAARNMLQMSADTKNEALMCICRALQQEKDGILEANRRDMEAARENRLAAPLLKRLLFDEKKLTDAISGIESLIKLEDPVGKELFVMEMDKDLELHRISCPLGVIGIVFESRPDALVQIAALCLKTGNAAIMKGGTEALHTNRILFRCISSAAESCGIPTHWLCLWETRDQVEKMLSFDRYIDLIIPRGSNEFVRRIMETTRIPVMGHADGVCHIYIHKDADPQMAARLTLDSKAQYAAVCNAAETLLIDEEAAPSLLVPIARDLEQKGVELFGCGKTAKMIPVKPVEDWHHEYLDYQMSVRIVSGWKEAADHINNYGSGHTDSIVTANDDVAKAFMAAVDSGNVFWNCSTRFSDGFRYGFGAEVGVSTSKLHARGPVGLEGLVTYKYLLYGKGQIVEDYANGTARFSHRRIL